MDSGRYAIEHSVVWECPRHPTALDESVIALVRAIHGEMHRRPAHLVYEMLDVHLARRLPDAAVDRELLRDVAARISVGLPALQGLADA